MPDYVDVPPEVMEELRTICLGFPDAYEQQAWAGSRWMIRKRTFAHVLSVDRPDRPRTVLVFRAGGDEFDALLASGPPFFRPGWGHDVMGMALHCRTDWSEVAELLTESYCIMAPKKLAALVDRPGLPD